MRYLPISTAIEPSAGLVECVVGEWWLVHPDNGLCFRDGTGGPRAIKSTSPDTNNLQNWAAPLEVRQYPRAFIPYDEQSGQYRV